MFLNACKSEPLTHVYPYKYRHNLRNISSTPQGSLPHALLPSLPFTVSPREPLCCWTWLILYPFQNSIHMESYHSVHSCVRFLFTHVLFWYLFILLCLSVVILIAKQGSIVWPYYALFIHSLFGGHFLFHFELQIRLLWTSMYKSLLGYSVYSFF